MISRTYRSHTLAASDVNTGELWILMGGLGWAPKHHLPAQNFQNNYDINRLSASRIIAMSHAHSTEKPFRKQLSWLAASHDN